ncbi:MAG: hypothetical protein EOO77_24925 [Oxalobacteraceae bacterium]|nr:MAG: hypothetical protein EOO77_24925 [Oxalobacteraceae bacterium]
MNDIPWREAAVLIREGRDPDTNEATREIVQEGSLRDVIFDVRQTTSDQRTRLKITLPDRRVRPYQYAGEEITALIHALVTMLRSGRN